jgi:hypothetical protein
LAVYLGLARGFGQVAAELHQPVFAVVARIVRPAVPFLWLPTADTHEPGGGMRACRPPGLRVSSSRDVFRPS